MPEENDPDCRAALGELETVRQLATSMQEDNQKLRSRLEDAAKTAERDADLLERQSEQITRGQEVVQRQQDVIYFFSGGRGLLTCEAWIKAGVKQCAAQVLNELVDDDLLTEDVGVDVHDVADRDGVDEALGMESDSDGE